MTKATIGLTVGLQAAACARAPGAGEPLAGLGPAERADFEAGRRVFETAFTPETGLGPLFNAEACAECHDDPVTGGAGDEIELHASFGRDDGACDLLLDRGGPVYQARVTPALHDALGIDAEPVPAGVPTAHRTSPDLFGFGLLEAVPEATLLALADPEDADHDGISGRVQRFADGSLGRFGRKALVPNLELFTRNAFPIEQGVTAPGALDEGTVGGQPLPEGVDPLPEPELDAERLRVTVRYLRFLAPPPPLRMGGEARRGRRVFQRIGCDACHVPVLRTGPSDVRALAHRRVEAYTDLLLHDMGPELADICFGEAQPAEFRTEPLMGLRFTTRFLHDGRAATIEAAIRLHGGEAAAARQAFEALPAARRRELLAFLGRL